MAPEPWATVTQKAWLEAHIAAFRQHQDNCIVGRFWAEVIREWFEAFPKQQALYPEVYGPLNKEQAATLCQATNKRVKVRTQLNWTIPCQAPDLLHFVDGPQLV